MQRAGILNLTTVLFDIKALQTIVLAYIELSLFAIVMNILLTLKKETVKMSPNMSPKSLGTPITFWLLI